MADQVTVRVRDCACPGTPHAEEGDVVFLRPTLGLEGGLAAEFDFIAVAALPENRRADAVRARWGVTFVRHGATGWNWVDERGKPVPFDAEVLVDDYALGKPISDRAADLYSEAVMRPLMARRNGLSQSGSTGDSTSAARPSTTSRRARSSPATSAATEPSTP